MSLDPPSFILNTLFIDLNTLYTLEVDAERTDTNRRRIAFFLVKR